MCGHLTPTQPRHEDMRMDSTLDVTPEGSLSDLPAASEIEMRGMHPSTTIVTSMEETPYTSVKTVPGRDSNKQRTSQVESPRRIQGQEKQAKRMLWHQLGISLPSLMEKNQVVTLEHPEEVPTVTAEGATAIASTVPTTSATTTITGTEAGSPRTFLPNGSPSRPTATATCRPQTWVQHVQRVGQMVLPQMALASESIVYLNFPYWKKVFQRI